MKFFSVAAAWACGVAPILPTCLAQMPVIDLPWGKYTATIFDSTNKIYTWRNVRFGHPTNETRFQASTYPTRPFNDDPNNGFACPQVDTTHAQCVDNSNGTYLPFDKNSGEDCLFLDIYVPDSAVQNAAKGIFNTPVVVWIYGGAYVFGSKDTSLGGPYNNALYNGTGPLIASEGNVILLAGNYRLGAFGWLAGPTMEKSGMPNAGLSDQRLVFQWVQDFIRQVGGDPTNVSAWGESAGASSILHHLISRDPKTGGLMPLAFNKVAIQSPAYEWQWDPKTLENTFYAFSNLANCEGCSLQQLQNVKYADLAQANQDLYQSPIGRSCTGLFPLGPSIDNRIIKQLTPVALAGTQGVDYKNLNSMIVSHVTNEAGNFVPWYLRGENNPTEAQFQQFLSDFIPEPNLKYLLPTISNRYSLDKFSNNQTIRTINVIQDAVFVCNTRHLFDAYNAGSTDYYALSYDFGDFDSTYNYAEHASDVPSIFYNQWWDITAFLLNESGCAPGSFTCYAIPNLVTAWSKDIAQQYQTLWTGHARTGDPNSGGLKPLNALWPLAKPVTVEQGNGVADVLIGNTLQTTIQNDSSTPLWQFVNDTQNGAMNCSFWQNISFQVEGILKGRKPGDGKAVLPFIQADVRKGDLSDEL